MMVGDRVKCWFGIIEKLEDGSPKTEVGRRKMEVRRPKMLNNLKIGKFED